MGRVHSGEISKNVTNCVTHAGSQLTWEGGGAGITKNVTDTRGVTTDLGGGGAGISKNVTNAGSQLTWEGGGAGISKNVTNAGSQLTY